MKNYDDKLTRKQRVILCILINNKYKINKWYSLYVEQIKGVPVL